MFFGVCGNPEMGRIAKDAGYDYFEWSVGALFHPREEEEAFEASLRQVEESGLPCLAANVFIPADLKITGPTVQLEKLEEYAATVFRRAEKAGVEVIVFGSGGARRIPEGFDRSRAFQQLVEFCRVIGPVAQSHRVTVVVEPLNLTETNVLNTVEESAKLVRQVNLPAIRLLVDGYHWAKDQNSLNGILENADLLRHAHVATVDGRRPPGATDECRAFFSALKQAEYNERLSIEGQIDDPAQELSAALEIMQRRLS